MSGAAGASGVWSALTSATFGEAIGWLGTFEPRGGCCAAVDGVVDGDVPLPGTTASVRVVGPGVAALGVAALGVAAL